MRRDFLEEKAKQFDNPGEHLIEDVVALTPLPEMTTAGVEGYLGLVRNLFKNSGIYAISSLAAPLATLLLSPFLTRVLSGTDYGVLAVLETIVTLMTGISELGLNAAFTRMYVNDCETLKEKYDALSTLALLMLLVLIPISLIGVVMAPMLSGVLLGSIAYTGSVQVAAVLILSQNLTVPGLAWLRVESRAVLFSTIAITKLVITGVANILLVGVLHMGVVGALGANGLGDVIIIICTLPVIFWRAGFHMRIAMAGSMLVFGIPHVTNLITGWILSASDRYLLGHFASLALAAGYSVAYGIGGTLSAAVVAPFSMAWWVVIYPIAKRKDALRVFTLVFRWFSMVLLLAAFGLSVFGASVLDWLFPPLYHAEALIIPVIALSITFNGIFNVVNLGTLLKRKTWLTSLYFIVASLINFVLNIIFIPVYGAMGAGIATLVAYIALALIAYLFNQRIYPVPFEIGLFLVALAIGILLYLLSYWLSQGQNSVMSWSIYIVVLLLYGGCLLFLGWSRKHSSL